MKRFHILIPDDDFEWLENLHEVNTTPISDIIRDAISSYRKEYEYAAYVASKAKESLDPTEKEDSDEGVRKRLKNLEAFVYEFVVDEFGFPSRALLRVPEFAPDYFLGKPPE
ncbi:MAG: hypothetical protein BMS9Abin05_1181 [Rhodothermia bacterium]|nr:MAG: hypothetical protein BMS9Abin05_1181 [Rhodothermia bacterium]